MNLPTFPSYHAPIIAGSCLLTSFAPSAKAASFGKKSASILPTSLPSRRRIEGRLPFTAAKGNNIDGAALIPFDVEHLSHTLIASRSHPNVQAIGERVTGTKILDLEPVLVAACHLTGLG